MKKVLTTVGMATMIASSSVMACEYQTSTGTYSVVNNYTTNNYITNYGTMNYYSNSGSGYQEVNSSTYVADTCGLCGLTWDLCTCYDYDYQEEFYGGEDYLDYTYGGSCDILDSFDGAFYSSSCESYQDSVNMAHWGNLLDSCGNIIGCISEGSAVEVIGQCEDNPSRTLIYDYSTGQYGTVASVYIYGGTDYEYVHPTEWSGCGYTGSYEEEYHYNELTPWAADTCPEYGTGYAEYYEESDCSEYWIDVDIEADTINLVNNGIIILSGTCTCASVYSGQDFYFSDQRCAGIWNQCSGGFYEQACGYMSDDCMVCCH